MAIPSEIDRSLGGARAGAHAALSSSIAGPIGETHLVAVDGLVRAFSRESLIGAFDELALDADHPPRLERGDFADTLQVTLADGATHELTVSSFERDSVIAVLNAPAEPAATPPPPEPTQEVKARPPTSASRRASPATRDPLPARQEAKAPSRYLRETSAAAVYYGTDVGSAGCVIQIVLFCAGVAAMWFAHDEAIYQAALLLDRVYPEEGFVYIVSKGLAVIAGMYLGGKAAGLFGRLLRRRNWGGRVEIERDAVRVVGPKGSFVQELDTTQPISIHVCSHTQVGTQNTSTPQKRNYTLAAQLEQQGHKVMLKSSQFETEPKLDVQGIQIREVKSQPTLTRTVSLKFDDFVAILRRVAG